MLQGRKTDLAFRVKFASLLPYWPRLTAPICVGSPLPGAPALLPVSPRIATLCLTAWRRLAGPAYLASPRCAFLPASLRHGTGPPACLRGLALPHSAYPLRLAAPTCQHGLHNLAALACSRFSSQRLYASPTNLASILLATPRLPAYLATPHRSRLVSPRLACLPGFGSPRPPTPSPSACLFAWPCLACLAPHRLPSLDLTASPGRSYPAYVPA